MRRPSKEKLYRDYVVDRLPVCQIAKKYGVKSPDTVQKWLRAYEIPKRRRLQEKPKPEKDVLEKIYLNDQTTVDEIASMFHVVHSTAWKWISDYGLNVKKKSQKH